MAPTYSVTISAHCNTEGKDVSVSIVEDGVATAYSTPHTFSGLSGTHTFTVPTTDSSGHSFLQWSTSQTTTTTVPSTTYTAYYQTSAKPPSVGGEWAPPVIVQAVTPANTRQMLALWIGVISLVALLATSFVYIRRKKRQS